MTRRIFLLLIVLVVVGFLNATAFALPPFGPPGNVLGQGQWDFDLVYGYSEMDLEAEGTCGDYFRIILQADETVVDDIEIDEESTTSKVKVKDFQSNMIFSSIGLGINNNWDAYVRLGGMDGEFNMGSGSNTFDGNWGFSCGAGTRATFMQQGNLSIGGLFQVTWANTSAEVNLEGDMEFTEDSEVIDVATDFYGHGELKWYEMQIAIGAIYQTSNNVSIYGGPFFYFLDGDLDMKGEGEAELNWEEDETEYTESVSGSRTCKFDIEQDSEFGGFAGLRWDIGERALMYVEGQFTGDGWGAFIGGIFGVP
jgi:hypothetical protein